MSKNRKEDEMKKRNIKECLFIVISSLEQVRKWATDAFKENDSTPGMATSEDLFRVIRSQLAISGVNYKEIEASLPTKQMREDLVSAFIVTMSSRNTSFIVAGMLYLKGVIMPLAEELKNARQTIESLMIATEERRR